MTLLEFVGGLQNLAAKALPMFTVAGGSGESQAGGR
jgi:hypothetical protein